MEAKWNNLSVPRNKKAVLSWNTRYAAYVHEGYTRQNNSPNVYQGYIGNGRVRLNSELGPELVDI